MADAVVTKKQFAALVGVTPGRVSQWISAKQISGAAIVGSGHRARIRVSVAREQLARTLDVDQRLSGNAKAKLDDRKQAASVPKSIPASTLAPASPGAISQPPLHDGDDDDDLPVEEKIKRQRLQQIMLSNAKAQTEAAAQSGKYVRADDARREAGHIAGRMVTLFDASLLELSNALAAHPATSARETLRILRSTWREIRARQAKSIGAEAALMPALLEDEAEEKNVSNC
jgi:DNA-binding transcriptional regulator YdaS (Cro superfamily)